LDPRVVDRVEGAHLTPGPVRKDPCNPLFVEDRPWEIQFDNLYPNVLFDRKEGLFKCWYNISVSGPEESETALCYATSPDGVHWEKPNLDLVEFAGSRANNIVVRSTHGAGVFEDPLDPDPDRRFKMFTRARAEGDSIREMGVSWSADGVRWAPPLICPHIRCRGDTHNNVFWDARSGNFVGITRRIDGIPGVIGQRIVARAESADFCSWSDAADVLRGDLRRQTYAMNAFPYANLYLGLVMMFDVDSDTVDCEIVQSPDTYRWERVCAGQPLIPRGPEGGYDHGCIYAAAHPIHQDGALLLYYGGSDQGHGGKRKGSLCRARLRADGFAAMEPRERGVTGVVVTNPSCCAEVGFA
jgi:hypothetical protein